MEFQLTASVLSLCCLMYALKAVWCDGQTCHLILYVPPLQIAMYLQYPKSKQSPAIMKVQTISGNYFGQNQN